MSKLKIITIITVVFYLAVLVGWQLSNSGSDFQQHVPGADNRPKGSMRKADEVVVGEFFMKGEATATEGLTGEWPCFRGANHDNICKTASPLTVGEKAFPVLWSIETGEGHAAPVVSNGCVYLLDYDEQISSDALRCIDLLSGQELWRRWYRVPMKRNHGFSRTIPAIYEDKVVTVGPEGHVMCCNKITGDMLWSMDMKKQFETEIPFWYTGQCPLVLEDGTLVLAPAGKSVLMMGVDIKTGEVRWQTPNDIGFKMSHSSIIPMTLGGHRTLVYAGVGGLCGISAEAGDCGKLLWHTSKWQPSVIAPSPLQLSANQFFMVAGYGAGGALVQVSNSGGRWSADVKDAYKADKGLSSEQQTPIFYDGMIISIVPKDGGGMRERVVCYSPDNLHKEIWSSAADERFGLGPYIVVDGKLFALNENGILYVYQIKGHGMTLLHKQEVLEEGVDAWGPMAYADGCLLLRDSQHVVCLRIE